ncbi:hypothetical protein EVA_14780 [gut metagenome]|uniref:Uncharacterized protein n=1 Tax=gut metagenome TaxID=749906 RepID=J9FRK2_9ZZZZ
MSFSYCLLLMSIHFLPKRGFTKKQPLYFTCNPVLRPAIPYTY